MSFIKSRQPVKVKIFGKQQPSTQTSSFVYINDEGECLVVQNGDYALNSELRHGKYHTVYEVDTSVYSYTFHKEVMCDDGQNAFLIRMRISFYVGNPEIIVRRGIVNSTNMLDELLFYSIKEVTRDYPIDQIRAVNGALKGLQNDSKFNRVFGEYGLAVEALEVDVELGHETRERLKRKMIIKDEQEEKRLRKEGEIENLVHFMEKYGEVGVFSSEKERTEFIMKEYERKKQEEQEELKIKREKDKRTQDLIEDMVKKGEDPKLIMEVIQTLNEINSEKSFVSSETDRVEKDKWEKLGETSELKRKERLDG
ncbi:hypothetical protein Q9B79_11185 [Bacillus sp. MHSD_36]|uniref:hypothetical protein n=1 Tax=unclassified Bacillus (in: firmicutes) TaxID=185979 RepID=UPI00274063A4|nr:MULTISPECIES: hypothetical protein [unclassified Bacillus (in: firmicutes)]MDP7990348.1 hypothetical protein [Bacillus sp. MHSD_36]MDR4978877.1 hypothetical protein [Bacillus sp. MHSD_37]